MFESGLRKNQTFLTNLFANLADTTQKMSSEFLNFGSQASRDQMIEAVHRSAQLPNPKRTETFAKFVEAILSKKKDEKVMEAIRSMLDQCQLPVLYSYLEADLPGKLLLAASQELSAPFGNSTLFMTRVSSILAVTIGFLRDELAPPSPTRYPDLGDVLREFAVKLMKKAPNRFEWCLCIMDIIKLICRTATPDTVACRREFWVLLNDCCSTFKAFPTKYQLSVPATLADTVPSTVICRITKPLEAATRESELESELCLTMFLSSLHALSVGELSAVVQYPGLAEFSVTLFPRVLHDVEAPLFPCSPALPLACLLYPQYILKDWQAEHKRRIGHLRMQFGIEVPLFTNTLQQLLMLESTLVNDVKTRERWFNSVSIVLNCLHSLSLFPDFRAALLNDPSFTESQKMIKTSTLLPKLASSNSPGITRMFTGLPGTTFGPSALVCALAGHEAFSLLHRRCLPSSPANPPQVQIATELRTLGNKEFAAQRFLCAANVYSMAMDFLDASSLDLALLLSNRAQCFLSLNHPEQALADAENALLIHPTHDKSLLRRTKALEMLELVHDIPPLVDAKAKQPSYFEDRQDEDHDSYSDTEEDDDAHFPDVEYIDEEEEEEDFEHLAPLLNNLLLNKVKERMAPPGAPNKSPAPAPAKAPASAAAKQASSSSSVVVEPLDRAPVNGAQSGTSEEEKKKKKKKKKNKKKKKPAADGNAQAQASSSSSSQAKPEEKPEATFNDSSVECPVCMDAPRNAALPSCGHVFCYDCALLFKVCPNCRVPVTAKPLRIFL